MKTIRFYILFLSILSAQFTLGQNIGETHDSTAIREILVPFEVDIYCENLRNSVKWNLESFDTTTRPYQLVLLGYSFESDDTSREIIKNQVLDSSFLSSKDHIWLNLPGYYKLEYLDTIRRIHFYSAEVRLDACSQYMLPEQFLYAPGKIYGPLKNQNVEKIDLVIFNSAGTEVFHTKNPDVLWDGRDLATGLLCPPGTYFFNCDVFEKKGYNVVKRNITGIIDLMY